MLDDKSIGAEDTNLFLDLHHFEGGETGIGST